MNGEETLVDMVNGSQLVLRLLEATPRFLATRENPALDLPDDVDTEELFAYTLNFLHAAVNQIAVLRGCTFQQWVDEQRAVLDQIAKVIP